MFLQALIDAEKFTKDSPEEAKVIVMKYTLLDKETIDGIWSSFDFRIALTPQLLEYLNREAQWAKDTGKVKIETTVPNFRDIFLMVRLKMSHLARLNFK
jgi:ABC-type nitrate/sulfonate/bicarbonate transport system substrate-binding protein